MLAREIRDYAVKELKLPDNASYRSYADIGRPYAVWNVVAAPEFSLEPLQSCFPVAGCVSYRGFFAQEDAERYAAGLRAQGNDVLRLRRAGVLDARALRRPAAVELHPLSGRGRSRGSCSTSSRTRSPT